MRKADIEGFPIRREARSRPRRIVNGKEEPLARREARRIEGLVIPPAWKNVRISADPRSHIQAVGRDEAGRRQYIYHPEWETMRSAGKARRLRRLVAALPRLRRRIARDLDRRDDRRMLATAARLVDRLALRAGHEEYAGEESGRGAATLLRKHVRIAGTTAVLDFPGKAGKRVVVSIADPKVARNLAQALELGGRRLFKLKTAHGWRNMTANDLNRYLAGIAGCDVSAKDFRTLNASAMALERLAACAGLTRPERRRALVAVVKEISGFLVNTPAVARKSYIHAAIIEQFESGALARGLRCGNLRNCTRGERLLHRFIAGRHNGSERSGD
ncbi:MAG: DNA topoisomerase IB [Parvibaculaceae bacterium]